jgi:hypothetical protein
MPNIFVGLWLVLILIDIGYLVRATSFWVSLLVVLFGPFLLFGSIVWGIRYLAYRYVSHVRITPGGLEVTRGESLTVHPWAKVGEIHTVPFVQLALWSLTFRDGSPTVAFFTEGSSWMLLGVVKARSKFVDEIHRLAGEAASQAGGLPRL